MNVNNQKGFANTGLVAVIVVLVGVVGYFAFVKKSEPVAQQPTPIAQPNTSTETPIVEENGTSQPAYLIAAYSKSGKNYIDVDYVEWLHGEASVKAQVEDGKCVSVSECYDYPNGYKRNQNPLVRTFEVSPSVSIVDGRTGEEQPLLISFKTLEDAVAKVETGYPYEAPFKEPKAFITLDVKDSIVVKITEPYQE